ncbi:MAG: hypothetical protein ACXABY_33025 [Candidatus Thorarchaeota archaeon]|jgi:hypothetical protein
MFREVESLAYDLREGGYTKSQLRKICVVEGKRLGLHPQELNRKVQAAYQSLFVYI